MIRDNSPYVSVIMPAYNGEKYIIEAIESVLQQTFSDFELIIIEDCSDDRTLQMIESIHDSRICLLENSTNMGISYSTNRGIDCSRGKYIALLDDDDIAERKRLEWQVSYMEANPKIDILGGKTTIINEAGEILLKGHTPRYNPQYIKATLLFKCMDFMNSTTMVRRSFLLNNGLRYRDNCFGIQDLWFFMESSKVGQISTIDEYLLRHREHKENESTRQINRNGIERAKKYALFQRESLRLSGFNLTNEDYSVINKVLAEFDGCCESLEEWRTFGRVLKKIVDQGDKYKMDFYNELKHVCRCHLVEQLRGIDVFNDELF